MGIRRGRKPPSGGCRDGLFGFAPTCDFGTFVFKDNIIECIGQARPMFRNDESARAEISNNTLINVSDASRYQNTKGGTAVGLEQPLNYDGGVHNEITVNGWKTLPASKP